MRLARLEASLRGRLEERAVPQDARASRSALRQINTTTFPGPGWNGVAASSPPDFPGPPKDNANASGIGTSVPGAHQSLPALPGCARETGVNGKYETAAALHCSFRNSPGGRGVRPLTYAALQRGLEML